MTESEQEQFPPLYLNPSTEDLFTKGFGEASNMAKLSIVDLLKKNAPTGARKKRIGVKLMVAQLPREEGSAPSWWRMKMILPLRPPMKAPS